MNYVPTVGLEIHSQLATKTKIFCGCSTAFGSDPNTHSCPVCLGMPGVLPVLNKRAVELAMRMALLTGGTIQKMSYFARKNYFYPDLPKGYQISMFEFPLIKGGHIDLETENGKKNIRFNRIHMEEDAGKLVHVEGDIESYFDVNRCGVPLIEIVTEPDFETLEEITQFLSMLKEMLVFSGASHGNMEQGNIRVDANISIRPEGQRELNTRTEIKNMNSFVNAVTAIRHEIARQTDIVESGGTVVQETLLYDAEHETLAPMRSKEEAHDYRYFPEPDLVPVFVDDEWIDRIRNELPEMPDEKRTIYVYKHGLSEYEAEILTSSPEIMQYYETTITTDALVDVKNSKKMAANLIINNILSISHETKTPVNELKALPAGTASIIVMLDKGEISRSMVKTVLDEFAATGSDPETIVEKKGLTQISDKGELEKIAKEIIESNPDEAVKYRAGKTKLLGFFIGQVMKETKGKANPREVNAILREMLS